MRCLESAQHQELREFELLLVDNSPDAELRSRVEEFNRSARIPARYVAEPRLGLHNARHAGARVANGDVLVFTDDDAVFDPSWLAAYARSFEAHVDMSAAGGPVPSDCEMRPPAWLSPLMHVKPRMVAVLSQL